jgi:hypothetical protein
MAPEYKTVFEVSYLTNGTLFSSVLILFIGILVGTVATIIRRRMPVSEIKATQEKFFYFRLVMLVWIGISTVWFISTIHSGYRLIHALRTGHFEVVEGTVQVLHREAWSGHDRGNIIQIADKTFGYSSHEDSLAYNWGEVLTDGVAARIYYLATAERGNRILKVEIKHNGVGPE